jgi:hypothetical protein
MPAYRLMEERDPDAAEELMAHVTDNGHPPEMADVHGNVHKPEAGTPDPHDQFPILGPIPAPGFDEYMAIAIPHCIDHRSPEHEVAGVAHEPETIHDPLARQRPRTPDIIEQGIALYERSAGAICTCLIERGHHRRKPIRRWYGVVIEQGHDISARLFHAAVPRPSRPTPVAVFDDTYLIRGKGLRGEA